MKIKIKAASFLTTLSLVIAMFGSTAFADFEYTGENVTVYNPSIVSYYWGWNGDWSVPYLKLSNGWHCSASQTLYAFTRGSYRGQVGYCMAPGVVFTDQADYWSKQENYLDGIAERIEGMDKDRLVQLMGLVLANSYSGDLKQSYFEDEVTGKEAFSSIWSCQAILWELITGERGPDFEYLGPDEGCSACKEVIRPGNPIYTKFCENYDKLESEVRKALGSPSFAKESTDEEPSYDLAWDGHRYTIDLTDTNEVTEKYSLSCSDENIRISRNGNTVTVSSDVPLQSSAEIVMSREVRSDNFVIMGSPGQNSFADIAANPGSYNQTLTFATGTVSDEKKAYFRVTTAPGEISLSKISSNCPMTEDNSNYSLEGAVYGVYTESEELAGTIVTDENGCGSLTEGISAGRTYRVRELKAPKGYLLDENVYEVIPGGTGTGGAFFEACEDPVNDPVAIVLTKRSATEGSVLSLAGTEFTVKYYDLDPGKEYTAEELEEFVPKKTWILKVRATETENGTVYKTQLSSEYLAEGSDGLYLSKGGEAVMPVGYFTVRETKAAEGFSADSAVYYSGNTVIGTGNGAIVGKLDFDGTIYPEGINGEMFSVTNAALPAENPDTGDRPDLGIAAVLSLAMLTAFADMELSERKRRN